uniref:Uncharacterized protein n=1 Tax=Solanum lycopersicum TaxID=4081 RepID=A0A3Q7GNZ6_SOLLC
MMLSDNLNFFIGIFLSLYLSMIVSIIFILLLPRSRYNSKLGRVDHASSHVLETILIFDDRLYVRKQSIF